MKERRMRSRRGVQPPDSKLAGSLDMNQMTSILPPFLDSLTDPIVVVDSEQRVVAANRRYLEVFGNRGSGEPTGQRCALAFKCPENSLPAGEACCVGRDVLGSGQPQRRVRTVNQPDGNSRRWEGSFSPILDDSGRVTHIVEIWRDLSERTKLESQLAHGERLATMGILAAGVAHEINNPLASIMACLESLSRIFANGFEISGAATEGREICTMLEREVERCRETTRKLTLLAQPYPSAPSSVDLNLTAGEVLSLLRFQAGKQNVRMLEHLDPALPPIWAIEAGIRSVCLNLMMNAIQAMTRGGTLRIHTALRDGMVELKVEDTGPGIAPEHMERIWDPFFTTKAPGEGTGLGLSVVERVVKRHGGRIRGENRSEGGARFVVELPVGRVGRSIG